MRKTKYDETYDSFFIYDNFLLNIYFNEINSTYIYRLKQKIEKKTTKLRENMAVKWPQWNARFNSQKQTFIHI